MLSRPADRHTHPPLRAATRGLRQMASAAGANGYEERPTPRPPWTEARDCHGGIEVTMPVLCPACHEDMDHHCAHRCQWMACVNPACRVRFVDVRNGHTTEKTRPEAEPA